MIQIKRRPKPVNYKARLYLGIAVAIPVLIAINALIVPSEYRPQRTEATSAAPSAEMKEVASNLTRNYIASGAVTDVTAKQAYVSSEWYEMTFEQKKVLAGALKVHFNATHYKFIDLHTGKTVAEYGELLGFRVH